MTAEPIPHFRHHDLKLLSPVFDSPLVDTLHELEHLRRLRLAGSTPPYLFFQLNRIFHIFESLGSARIEGNHTTLSDYVEHVVAQDDHSPVTQSLLEVQNIEAAMDYVDATVESGTPLTGQFVRELHQLTVGKLDPANEGDRTPGAYRTGQVRIAQSNHLPPDPSMVQTYMDELVDFVNRADAPKYDLMKVALAHHRFGWIHPFSNGNGRVVRLLTYALLLKYGFKVGEGNRLLNPTAVFCNDRTMYYTMLATADTGTPEGLEQWCTYVLSGILRELEKVGNLLKFEYLKDHILDPAIRYSMTRQHITKDEGAVLALSLRTPDATVRAGDLESILPGLNPAQRTYKIKKLVDRHMLLPVTENGRTYYAGFANSYLLRGVMVALREDGFIPDSMGTVQL